MKMVNIPSSGASNEVDDRRLHDEAIRQSAIDSREEILLDIRKKSVETLCIQKTSLNGLTARVALVLDVSGSMYELYKKGTVQEIVNLFLPVAMNFDDNGEMELWTFGEGCRRCPPITKKNYIGYVQRNIGLPNSSQTNYAPVIKDIYRKYVEEEPAKIPTYVMFITDGDNGDRKATTDIITQVSRYPIFFQFIGIGACNFSYLEELDTMKGRYVDNANFFSCNDIIAIDTEEDSPKLYSMLLREYPEWLKYPRVQRMLQGEPEKKGILSQLMSIFKK